MANEQQTSPAGHEKDVERYYTEATPGLYVHGWNPDHIHFGLFEPGERPSPGESLSESEGLARAVVRMIDVVVAPADVREHHHVVDAGCGIGGTAIHLARTVGCKASGVNLNPMQLEIAQQKSVEAGVEDRVSFQFADCTRHLPFADNSIDVVVNIESACHYSDRVKFLEEVRRILKPGGRIAAMDWMARDGLTEAEYEEYIVPLNQPFAVHNLESESSYTAKLADAGLNLLEFEDFDGKDADNLKIVEYSHNLLASIQFFGVNTPAVKQMADQFKPLYKAWNSGSFELRRYCAEKP